MTTAFLAGIALVASHAMAQAKRVALVVGNDKYQALTPLQKAVNDARAVKAALTDLGFKVIDGENLTRRALNQKLADLDAAIEPGDQVFVFYAGHGVAIGAENYLLPVDMPLPQGGQETLVRNEGHAADAIIRTIQGKGAATTFVVLDACRNNPIADRGTRNIGLDRGLARMDATAGVFVLFSAGIGQTALDRLSDSDREPNSVFTRKLVPLLRTPGLSHVDLAKELQQQVSTLAATIKHRQEPAYYDQIIGRVVLKEGVPEPKPATAVPSASDSELAKLKAEIEELRKKQDRPSDTPAQGWWPWKRDPAKPEQDRPADQAMLAPAPKPDALELKPEPAAPAPVPPAASGTGMKPGTVFRDCPKCPEMVVVPAGSFMMGSPDSEESRRSDEGPQHKVTIEKPYAVGKFEVTFAEWDACVSVGGCKHKPQTDWGRGRQPVMRVSWHDASEYTSWLSKKSGRNYRLLSEAEWEYAARAGTTTPFSTGETIAINEANFDGSSTNGNGGKGKNRQKTIEAGSFKPNAFGLHDMHGNVWEWVEDCHRSSYAGAPASGTAVTSGDCSNRVGRGGSWYVNPEHLRSAGRASNTIDFRDSNVGFRVARTLD